MDFAKRIEFYKRTIEELEQTKKELEEQVGGLFLDEECREIIDLENTIQDVETKLKFISKKLAELEAKGQTNQRGIPIPQGQKDH